MFDERKFQLNLTATGLKKLLLRLQILGFMKIIRREVVYQKYDNHT